MSSSASIMRARALRRDANAPEQAAWRALRQLRQQGFPVRRQHPVGRFIVDFAIASAKLVIEIDGTIHNRDDVILKDQEREQSLKALGWDVLRFTGDEAFDADYLIREVTKKLGI